MSSSFSYLLNLLAPIFRRLLHTPTLEEPNLSNFTVAIPFFFSIQEFHRKLFFFFQLACTVTYRSHAVLIKTFSCYLFPIKYAGWERWITHWFLGIFQCINLHYKRIHLSHRVDIHISVLLDLYCYETPVIRTGRFDNRTSSNISSMSSPCNWGMKTLSLWPLSFSPSNLFS